MSRQDPIAVVPSAARTTSGSGSVFNGLRGSEHSDVTQLAVLVDLTAVAGTSPTMTVSVEWSHDGTAWAIGDPADAFTALTVAGKRVKVFTKKAPFARIAWTIGGTSPSFTFSVSAYGV